LHERIKELRKYLGLTQAEFGEKIAMRQTGVAWLESGDRKITDRVITTICAVFGVDEIWLRTGEGEMFREPTIDEQIAGFVGDVLSDKGDEFQKRVMRILASLGPEGWKALSDFLDAVEKADKQ
jgi:transcriptional regulator with XRE-family HTH domain